MTTTTHGPELTALRDGALIDALESSPAWPWRGRGRTVSPVGGGISNLNWRLSLDDGQQLFVKIPGTGSEDFVDRELCHAANVRAAEVDVAPAVLHYDERSGVEVFEFLDGYRGLSHLEISSSTLAFGMIDVYRRLHAAPRLGMTRTVHDDIEDSREVLAAQQTTLPAWCQPVMAGWEKSWQALSASGYDTVISHNDPNFTNMMYAPGRPLRLVDYEFCADNDPAYDVGTFIGIFCFDAERRNELLEHYFGRYEFRLDARCHLYCAAMYVRYGLWCIAQARARDADFDYEKYGLAYFANALAIQCDPRWEAWLSAC